MRVALFQARTGVDPSANAAALVDACERAAAGGAAMLFTPEMSGLLDRDARRAAGQIAAEEDDMVLQAVRRSARDLGIWVQLGSLAVRRPDGKLANRSLVVDDSGAVRARYDKIHLFDVDLSSGESWRESARYAAGDQAVVVDTLVGRLGLSICYDLRFPALFASLAAAGATILSVPAAFTVPTGQAHWHVLLRARAIETGTFVVAAAQRGLHEDGRATFGHSLAVDPWGRTLLYLADAENAVGFATIDPALIAEARGAIPALTHQRRIDAAEIAA
ncbi:MAG: FIG147869: Carbon-nitrogen hydrolase [uncultured Sphingomonadaceae bacterium]|uniref:FIG147869: Carbon-nitrogen hydrolase n=1 Tax=uncultured Sphingomonadaceae bacterium TaxID=169976 RepID=A0A6J4T3Y4_9SPHN|nr:MAG: FIG147869: Carbon-nitrogen hydrolase [uncultured Sphingomonadaceae bacterium]